jgi:hypothetical protein
MKALTILQPWAQLIIAGKKLFETRSWQTAHRGPLVIHAGSKFTSRQYALVSETASFSTALHAFKSCNWALPLGKALGVVNLVNCVPTDAAKVLISGTDEEHFGDFRPGRWAWELHVLKVFDKPVPIAGHLGLWECPVGLLPEWTPGSQP